MVHRTHLAAICLPKAHDRCGVNASHLCRAPRSHPAARRVSNSQLPETHTPALDIHSQPDRDVVHVVQDDPAVCRNIVGTPSHMRLEDVGPIQKRLLAVGLDPSLVAGVLGEDGQRGDVQAELARLCKLAEADAERDELVARDGRGDVGEREEHVVDAVLLHAKNVAVRVWGVAERGDEVLEGAAGVRGELCRLVELKRDRGGLQHLFKDGPRLGFCAGTHRGCDRLTSKTILRREAQGRQIST